MQVSISGDARSPDLGLACRHGSQSWPWYSSPKRASSNIFVDFDRAQAARGLGAVVRIAQHYGFRFLVAFAAAILLFAYVNGGQRLKCGRCRHSIRQDASRLDGGTCAAVACLVPLSYLLYRDGAAPLPFAGIVALWLVIGALVLLSALLSMAPWRLWLGAAAALGNMWWYAAIVALLGAGAMQLSQRPVGAHCQPHVRPGAPRASAGHADAERRPGHPILSTIGLQWRYPRCVPVSKAWA